MTYEDLLGAPVELTDPEGRVYRFEVECVIPYAGQSYVVLHGQQDHEQLLITHPEQGEDGTLGFVVAQEEDIIEAVMEKRLMTKIREDLRSLPDVPAEQ